MRALALELPIPSHSERLYELLDKADYRIAVTDEDRDAVFRLRYEAYLREQMILPNFSGRLTDSYDDRDNTTIFGVWVDGELASTLRISVASEDYPELPAMGSFAEELGPEFAAGKVIVDASRFATGEAFSRRHPGLMPYITTRIPWMAMEYYGADTILATVRTEHQAFYRRVFGGQVVCGARHYATLIKPLSLMTCDYRAERERVEHRNPTFRSTYFERRALFEWQPRSPAPLPRRMPRIPMVEGAPMSGSMAS